jgi:6-phosphogluconolactonase
MPGSAARRLLAACAVALPALAACSADRTTASEPDAPRSSASRLPDAPLDAGAVYTMTDAVANAVLAFRRAPDGSLRPLGAFPTGGAGTGGTVVDPLASQHSLRLSPDRRFLYAVNAGSDDVTVFDVGDDGALTALDREPSGGDMPVSVAEHDRLLYVLNSGDGTLQGLRVGRSGELNPVPHSARKLGLAAGSGADVQFTPNGRQLVISYKGGLDAAPNGGILVFPVEPNGRLGEPARVASFHPFAFGVDATDDFAIVAETVGFASTYSLGPRPGPLSSAETKGIGVCWVVITRDGRYAYLTNTGSSTLAGFVLERAGRLTPIGADPIVGATPPGSAPLDLDTSTDDRFLYVLEGATGFIAAFAIGDDGTLTRIARTPTGATTKLQGLAAY